MTVVANDHGILAAGEFCCVQPTCNKRPSTWIGAALEDLHMHYNLVGLGVVACRRIGLQRVADHGSLHVDTLGADDIQCAPGMPVSNLTPIYDSAQIRFCWEASLPERTTSCPTCKIYSAPLDYY